MSPLDFPDLLQQRPPEHPYNNNKYNTMGDERGRRGGNLISNMRARSRSRRRAASVQPERARSSSLAPNKDEMKKRRSLSRPSGRANKEDKYSVNQKTEIVDLTNIKSKSKRDRSKSVPRKVTAKSSSPSKRRPSNNPASPPQPVRNTGKSKEFSKDVINLVDVKSDDEDFVLSNILRDEKQKTFGSSSNLNSNMRRSIDDSHESPKTVSRFPETPTHKGAYSDDEDESSEEEESDDEEDDDANSVATNDLLEEVNARMAQQRLTEEVKELRAVIEKKNAEIDQLTGQLKMAISTKCDLVIAHTELERLHERDMKERESYADQMKRRNLEMMEMRAEVEREFMNELADLSRKVQESEQRRKEQAVEKDTTIKLLEDKIRRMERNALQGTSARPETDKVKFYKKRLGVYDE